MTYAWVHTDDGRSVFRKAGQIARHASDFPCPMIIKDTIEPVRSMADGKMYDSMSSLRRTYRADGNPQGQEYIEVGDAPMKGKPPLKHATKQEIADLLDKTEAQIARGEIPQTQELTDD
jgi:hypothetical protein